MRQYYNTNYLAHYGVKGMRWGHRKARITAGLQTFSGKVNDMNARLYKNSNKTISNMYKSAANDSYKKAAAARAQADAYKKQMGPSMGSKMKNAYKTHQQKVGRKELARIEEVSKDTRKEAKLYGGKGAAAAVNVGKAASSAIMMTIGKASLNSINPSAKNAGAATVAAMLMYAGGAYGTGRYTVKAANQLIVDSKMQKKSIDNYKKKHYLD